MRLLVVAPCCHGDGRKAHHAVDFNHTPIDDDKNNDAQDPHGDADEETLQEKMCIRDRDEVSFFFLLSHLTALPCIATVHEAVHIWAVHEFLQDAKLLFSAGRHQILPLLRQYGQICDAPLNVFGIVDIGRSQFYQMPDAPADELSLIHI